MSDHNYDRIAVVQPSSYVQPRQAIIVVAFGGAAFIGLHAFLGGDVMTHNHPSKKGTSGYDFGNLFGILVWVFAFPTAIATILSWWMQMYKLSLEPSQKLQALMASLLLAVAALLIIVGLLLFDGKEIVSCGILWCGGDKSHANLSMPVASKFSQSKVNSGIIVFLVGVVMAVLAVWFFLQSWLGGRRASKEPLMKLKSARDRFIFKRRMAAVVLIVFFFFCLVLTSLLPPSFEGFVPEALSAYMSEEVHPEFDGAWMTTWNLKLSDSVTMKFYPDTVIFYGYLEILVFAGIFIGEGWCRGCKNVGLNVGRLFLALWSILCLSLYISYWLHDHKYHGDLKFDSLIEKAARTFGLVASAVVGLTLFPASKTSPLLMIFGVSWESAVWLHKIGGVLFVLSALGHAVTYFIRFCQLGYPQDILPFNAWLMYPQNPVGGKTPTDNWTVALMVTIFWPVIISYGVFPWFRSRHWELFRYTHNIGLVLIPAMLWHTSSGWMFLLPGTLLWIVDFVVRYMANMEDVCVLECTPLEIECWTDPRPGEQARSRSELITKVRFTWPGQARIHSPGMYVLVNFPQISTHQWHPFSLSSSPTDKAASLHVKNMGPLTFTGALHKLANRGSESASQSNIIMNLEGPYGPLIDLDKVETVVLAAGGIGITAIISTWRFLIEQAGWRAFTHIRRLRLVWSARSVGLFEEFRNELTIPLDGLSITTEVSLYCSTCMEGSGERKVNNGPPCFEDIFAEEQQHGTCLVRVCGPPPMVNACERAAASYNVDFEPWSFVL